MHYKSIIHDLLQQRPQMHDQLRKSRKLLPTLEQYARELKTSHEAWKEMLSQLRPGSDPTQIASEAMEMAVKEMEDRLPSESPRTAAARSPRRGDAVPPPSHVARLKASRNRQPALRFPLRRSLFGPPTPTGALNGGTLLSPPGRASGNPVPPEGLPQLSAGPVAARAEPRLGAESYGSPSGPNDGAGSQRRRPRRARQPVQFAVRHAPATSFPPAPPVLTRQPQPAPIASGEKSKARDILTAIRTLKQVEEEKRPATEEEKQALARFAGFGPVALSIFPDPVTGRYKDAGWQALGEELKTLLTPRRIRQRQTHHLQCLLYVAHRDCRNP